MNDLITFVANEIGAFRRETLEGREHIVIPMVMMVEGVQDGSEGPLMYQGTDLHDTAAVWNHKPVIVNHAQKDGAFVSACKPEYLNAQKVGIVLNSRFTPATETEPGKLRAEAWIEPDRLKAVNPTLYKKVLANKTIEISTGLFKDEHPSEGEFNGEKFKGLAVNIQPDHLAILTHAIGACSCKKGCGLNANQEGGDLTVNAMSHSKTHEALQSALYESSKTPGGLSGYVRDVYPDFCVIQHRDTDKLYKHSYTVNDKDEVSFTGTPKELKRVTEYRTADKGAFVGNFSITDTQVEEENVQMDKKELVTKIITANKGWTETNRPELEAMSEPHLKLLVANCEAPPPPPPVVPPVAPPAVPPVVANQLRQLSEAEWMALAPPNVRATLTANMEAATQMKAQIADRIIANQTRVGVPAERIFGKDYLMACEPKLLEGLDITTAAAVHHITANGYQASGTMPQMYAGAAGGIPPQYGAYNYQNAFTANMAEDDEPLGCSSSFPDAVKK